MKIEHHITLSAIISGILYAIFKSWGLSIASLITGIFIDVDHIIDYFFENGFRIQWRESLNYFYKEEHQRITLLFHGWEWLCCLGIAAVLTEYNLWVTGALIGYGHHIISDYFYSKTGILTYSLIWRWDKRFDSKTLFPRDRGYNPKL